MNFKSFKEFITEAKKALEPPFLPTPTMAELFALGVKPEATQRDTTIVSELKRYLTDDERTHSLDYGAGRCHSKNSIPTIEMYEIEPPEKAKPTYTVFDSIKKKYKLVINTYVLNVCAEDVRRIIVSQIGSLLDEGGRAIIVTRGTDVAGAKTYKDYKYGELEHITKGAGGLTYQKGYYLDELIDFCQEVLGSEFTVKKFQGSTASSVRVQITRD